MEDCLFQALSIPAAHQRPGCVSRSVACSRWSSPHWRCHVMYDWQRAPRHSLRGVHDWLVVRFHRHMAERKWLPLASQGKREKHAAAAYRSAGARSDAAESPPRTLAALSIEMKWDGKLPLIQCYPGHCPRRLWWSASYFIWAANRVPLSPAEACVFHLIPHSDSSCSRLTLTLPEISHKCHFGSVVRVKMFEEKVVLWKRHSLLGWLNWSANCTLTDCDNSTQGRPSDLDCK